MPRAHDVTAIRLTAWFALVVTLSAPGRAAAQGVCPPMGPAPPGIISPAHNEIINTPVATVTWASLTPPYSIIFYIAKLYDFSTGQLVASSGLTGMTQFTSGSLQPERTYFWEVAAVFYAGCEDHPVIGNPNYRQFRTPQRIVSASGDLAFGDVAVGATATRVLTIHNTGWSPLSVDSISYPAGFSGSFAGTVPAGGSRVVPVRFSPLATTSYGGTLAINGNQTSGTDTMTLSGTGTPSPSPPPPLPVSDARRAGDFDGDGKNDVAVFRASTGSWYALKSSENNASYLAKSWGLSTDTPMPGDYDGDGKADPAVFRSSTGTWYVLKSSTNYGSSFGVSWGLSTDVPVPADYDGDGKTDPAIYRPSTGLWALLKSSTNYSSASYVSWGLSTDLPMAADYDGDGKSDPAVFRPSTGGWYVLKSSTNYGSSFGVSWGLSTDTPVPGDYDGDGKADPAVFRGSTGGWYLLRSTTNYASYTGLIWGVSGDVPAPGDFDGDRRTDPAFFRPSTGVWSILKSDAAAAHRWTFDEASGDVAFDSSPVAGFMDGALGPGAHRTAGAVGAGALQFDVGDMDGYVTAPADAAALGMGDFTISFWILRTPGASLAELVGNRGGHTSHGNFVDFYADGDDIGFEIDENIDAKGYIPLLSSGAGVNDGAWHKITGVRSGPNASLYIDGALAASGTASDGFTANLLGVYNFEVGVSDYARGAPAQWLDCGCSFDDVRIYKRALSALEIQMGLEYSPFSVPWGLSSDTPINKRP